VRTSELKVSTTTLRIRTCCTDDDRKNRQRCSRNQSLCIECDLGLHPPPLNADARRSNGEKVLRLYPDFPTARVPNHPFLDIKSNTCPLNQTPILETGTIRHKWYGQQNRKPVSTVQSVGCTTCTRFTSIEFNSGFHYVCERTWPHKRCYTTRDQVCINRLHFFPPTCCLQVCHRTTDLISKPENIYFFCEF